MKHYAILMTVMGLLWILPSEGHALFGPKPKVRVCSYFYDTDNADPGNNQSAESPSEQPYTTVEASLDGSSGRSFGWTHVAQFSLGMHALGAGHLSELVNCLGEPKCRSSNDEEGRSEDAGIPLFTIHKTLATSFIGRAQRFVTSLQSRRDHIKDLLVRMTGEILK